jgi:hypothetical protein
MCVRYIYIYKFTVVLGLKNQVVTHQLDEIKQLGREPHPDCSPLADKELQPLQ